MVVWLEFKPTAIAIGNIISVVIVLEHCTLVRDVTMASIVPNIGEVKFGASIPLLAQVNERIKKCDLIKHMQECSMMIRTPFLPPCTSGSASCMTSPLSLLYTRVHACYNHFTCSKVNM